MGKFNSQPIRRWRIREIHKVFHIAKGIPSPRKFVSLL
jgi:hypothetical protein